MLTRGMLAKIKIFNKSGRKFLERVPLNQLELEIEKELQSLDITQMLLDEVERLRASAPPLEIECGKFYQTRDGQKVRIYAIDGNGQFPFHGAVYWPSSGWEAYSWSDKLSVPLFTRDNDADYYKTRPELDIVSEWEPK